VTADTELDFQPPDALQPVLTGLRERFEDAIKEVGGHRGEVVVELERDRLVEVSTRRPASGCWPASPGSTT
jgi:hypothetical protein